MLVPFRRFFIALVLAVFLTDCFLTGCGDNTANTPIDTPSENAPPVPQNSDDVMLDKEIADALKDIERHATNRQKKEPPKTIAISPAAKLPPIETDGLRKARLILNSAQMLLLKKQQSEAKQQFEQADSLLTDSDKPFAAAMLELDITSAYSLLNEPDKARQSCSKAEQFIQKISDKTLQAAAKLRFAEILLTVRTIDPKLTLAEQLADIKKGTLDAAKTVEMTPMVPEAATADENPLMLPVPAKTEMLRQKETLLRKVSDMFSAAGMPESFLQEGKDSE